MVGVGKTYPVEAGLTLIQWLQGQPGGIEVAHVVFQ
jgi:hypothetical protein